MPMEKRSLLDPSYSLSCIKHLLSGTLLRTVVQLCFLSSLRGSLMIEILNQVIKWDIQGMLSPSQCRLTWSCFVFVFVNGDVAQGAKAFWKKGLPLIHRVSVSVHVPSWSLPLNIIIPEEKQICPSACSFQSVFSQVMWISTIFGSSDLPNEAPWPDVQC